MAETIHRLKPGDHAPEPEVRGADGSVSLATAWADGPAVLVFLRHFG